MRGAVVGDVVASREVVIFASGRPHGDVESPSVVIERGATFNGRVRMYRPERSVQDSVPAERPPRRSLTPAGVWIVADRPTHSHESGIPA